MDFVSKNVGEVVAILTAILSEQEDLAYELVLDSDPIELFTALTAILLASINTISEMTGITVENYLRDLGMLAFRTQ